MATASRKRGRGAATVEYALFAMAMVVGTAAAKHLVGQRGAGLVEIASAVMDDGAGSGGSFAGGGADGDGDGRRGSARGEEPGGVTGGGGPDATRESRRTTRRQGSAPRAIVTLKDDDRSAP